MSKYQPNPKHSLTRGASVARGLNAVRTIAPSVLAATIYYQGSEHVLEVEAGNSEQVGRIAVAQGQHLYIVASKFENRYYLVTLDGQCSSFDDRVAAGCVAKVQAHQKRNAA